MFEKLQAGEKIHDAPRQPRTCSHPIYFGEAFQSKFWRFYLAIELGRSLIVYCKWAHHLLSMGRSRYMAVCHAAQENGAHKRSEYIDRNNKVEIFMHP